MTDLDEPRVPPLPSLSDKVDDDASVSSCSDDGTGEFKSFKKHLQRKKGGGVHFGSVRVRTHELTLGDNPGGQVGLPLTLEWDPMDSTRFANVDDFAKKYHGQEDTMDEHHPAHRLAVGLRQEIAAQGHSAGSLRRVQREIHEIRRERIKSSKEDPATVVEDTSHKKEKHHHGGFLQRLFKSS